MNLMNELAYHVVNLIENLKGFTVLIMWYFVNREGPGCEQTEFWWRWCHCSNGNWVHKDSRNHWIYSGDCGTLISVTFVLIKFVLTENVFS